MALLEEYKAYYRSRMQRYENNPLYPNSYASEKALFEAMDSCMELEEFKGKLEAGNLNIKNAIALVKDKYTIRLKHFTELKEVVRALGPQRVLEKIDQAQTDMEVVNIVSDLEMENNLEITADEFVDTFYGSIWKLMEDIEVYRDAEIPEKHRARFDASIKEMEESIRKHFNDEEENNRHWKAGWTFDFDLLWEERHRRKIPFPDETLRRRIEMAKAIRG